MSKNTTTPSKTINQNSQAGFMSLQIITSSCHSVLNTVFISSNPKPIWFDDLNAKLAIAKTNAQNWIDNLAPQITGSIPSHVIDYQTTYDAMTASILDLASKNPTAKGSTNPIIIETLALMDALSSQVGDIITNINTMQGSLKTWGDAMQKSHDDLSSGATNIQNLEISLQSDIDKMNSHIQNLHDLIAAENKIVLDCEIAVAVGIFVAVAAIALTVATAGTTAGVTGTIAAVAIGGTIAAGVTWGIMQSKINANFDSIAKDQQEKDADNQQIVALQGLALASKSAITAITSATLALSDVKTMWTVFQGALQGTQNKLNSGNDQLSEIVLSAFTTAAKSEWDYAVVFANNLLGLTVSNDVNTVDMSGKVQAA